MVGQWIFNELRDIGWLRTTVRSARRSFEPYRLPTWTLQGNARGMPLYLRLLFAGQIESKNYAAQLAFETVVDERSHGKMWTPAALGAQLSPLPKVDVMMIDVHRTSYLRWSGAEESKPEQGIFCLPGWVRGEIPLVAGKTINAETIRSERRLIARNGLEYCVTRDSAQFDLFYRTMYLPYMAQAYPGQAHLMSYKDMQEQKAYAELVQIRRGGETIAAQIVLQRDGQAHAWSVGVKNGDRALVKAGVLAALYHFVPEYLRSKGYAVMDVGLSRPFLNDGVLRYKRKWGLRLQPGHEKLIVLKVATTPGAEAFLQHNPCIYLRGGKLCGAIFLKEESDYTTKFEQTGKHYFIPGLSALDFYVPSISGDGWRLMGSYCG